MSAPNITETFLENFHHVATIGATDRGGVHRPAATEEDRRTRDWFRAFAAERGWEVSVDGIGNLFARVRLVEGAEEHTPFILTGSHLDSQPRGGRFDGAYGVIASLHAAAEVEQRIAAGELVAEYDLVVVDWFDEEGGRFAPSIMGSSVYAGLMDREEMLDVADLDGVTVREALESIGYLGSDPAPSLDALAGYAEIHIEQGRILEREGLPLGAVDSSWYTQKLDIEVLGEQSHTGATAMADRRDALVGASHVVLMFQEICREFPEETLVSSVGQVTVEPNSPIVVNSRVHLVADLRADDPQIVKDARERLLERFAELGERLGLEIVSRDFDVRPNLYFPVEGVELVEKTAADLGMGIRRIRTMAGHDSIPLNTVAPTVMMFIPSVDGVSHCEREFTTDEDMVSGLTALVAVLGRMLGGELSGVGFPGSASD
ncbi:M20 family metallo-hydrolase [Brevibacterium ihuae]|uniref:M20 family metallo-hydrolase n=1 Tax=Brevibacterium ihuae TaxID=1631743 RepID=UPI001FE9181F|nr:M20 family metallo-hydrolase [Brevibacterium ihuae]